MNYNQNFYPGGFGGAVYQAPVKPVNFTQAATKEELEAVKKQAGGFNLNIPQEEFTRAYCTHRTKDRFTVSVDDEGYMICSQCGKRFKPFEGSVADARELTENFENLLETTKMQALTMAPEAMRNYFQYAPFAHRLPDLFSQTQSEYKRALGMDQYYYTQDQNAFNMYNSMINPMAGNGYYDPSMMWGGAQPQYQYGQPMMNNNMGMPNYGQPMMNNNMGMNMQPTYAQPMMNNNMGMPNYGYQQQPSNAQGNPFDVNSSLPNNANKGNNDTVTVTKPLTD